MTVSPSATSATFASSFLRLSVRGTWWDNLRRILVIVEELTEGVRHHLLDDILLVYIFELPVDIGHVRCDKIFIDIGLHDVVHRLIKLLLANLLRRGERAFDEILANNFLYGSDLELLADMNDGDARTLLSRTPRTSGAVRIVLHVVGESIVDDVREVIDIEAARCHIRSDKQLHEMLSELLHGEVTLLLREVAMERLGIVPVFDQFVRHLLRLELRAAEDDGIDAGIIVDNTLQRKVFVFGIDQIIDMVDVLRAFIARADNNLLIIMQIVSSDLLYLLTHRSREEQRVTVLGHLLEDRVDTVGEAHVQHLVSLIEHHVADVVELHLATLHEVNETARGSHDDLRAMTQLVDLRADRRAPIHGDDVHVRDVLGKRVEVIGNLQTQLACWTEDQRLCVFRRGIGALKHRDTVGCRLTGAGLCQGYDVVVLSKQIRDYFLLYGHGLLEPKLFNGAADRLAHAQFFKCLQKNSYII